MTITKYMKTPLSILTLLSFLITGIIGPMPAYAQEGLYLPKPGVMVRLSPPLDPPMLKGIKVHVDNPFRFDFILDKGDSQLANDQLKEESTKLIKYFLASLTIPEKDLWVNLSPYEKDRIIPNSFGLTEMGRDLLAQDYMLKQITASLIYPEDEIGKKFWKRIYEEASKKYGTTSIPVNTFNKVWIMPEKAVVYENAKAGTAYVVESKLKVMLEQDYLSLEKHGVIARSEATKQSNDMSTLGSQIVREIVIPELTREVIQGKNFSQLRQVYNSLILATWYKKKIKDSILLQVYMDKNKTAGVDIDDPQEKQKIYEQYLKAFKEGVYNYIKEEANLITKEMIPRKYFSGGAFLGLNLGRTNSTMAHLLVTNIFPNQAVINNDRAMIIESETMPAKMDSLQKLERLGKGKHSSSSPILYTNEEGFSSIFSKIRMAGSTRQGTAHIGVGGVQNLDIMAARQSEWGILIDIDGRVGEFYKLIKDMFNQDLGLTRENFIQKLMERMNQKPATNGVSPNYFLYEDFDPKGIMRFLSRKDSWLADDFRYEHIKQMFKENRIIFIHTNMENRNVLTRVNRWIKKNNTSVDTLYISNVEDWIHNEKDNRDVIKLYANVKMLSNNATLILACSLDGHLNLKILRRYDFAMNSLQDTSDRMISSALQDKVLGAMRERDNPDGRLEALRRLLRMKGVDIEQWANEQAGEMNQEDINKLKEALSSIGIDTEHINTILDKIILVNVPAAIRLEGIRSRIGGIVIQTQTGPKILFPKDRIVRKFRNTEDLGDLLHDVVEIQALQAGRNIDEAHSLGIKARDEIMLESPRAGYEFFGESGFPKVLARKYKNSSATQKAQDVLNSLKEKVKQFPFLFNNIRSLIDNLEIIASDRARTLAGMFIRSQNDNSPWILINGNLVNSLNETELRFVIGHEFGHLLLKNVEMELAEGVYSAEERQIIASLIEDRCDVIGMLMAQEISGANDISNVMTVMDNLIASKAIQLEDGDIIDFEDPHRGISDRIDFLKEISLETREKLIERLNQSWPTFFNFQNNSDVRENIPDGISENGGIDLTPANMNLQTQNAGGEIKFHLDPAMLAQLQNAPGFVPVIINIQPMTNLPAFLGISESSKGLQETTG